MSERLKLQETEHAGIVEISFDETGKFWLNVDGRCVVRIGECDRISVKPPGQNTYCWSNTDPQRADGADDRRTGAQQREEHIAPHGKDRRFRDRRLNNH